MTIINYAKYAFSHNHYIQSFSCFPSRQAQSLQPQTEIVFEEILIFEEVFQTYNTFIVYKEIYSEI